MRLRRVLAASALSVAWVTGSLGALSQSLTAPPSELPVTVAIGLYYVDFDSVDIAHQNFRVMGYMSLRWKDPRLAFDPQWKK